MWFLTCLRVIKYFFLVAVRLGKTLLEVSCVLMNFSKSSTNAASFCKSELLQRGGNSIKRSR